MISLIRMSKRQQQVTKAINKIRNDIHNGRILRKSKVPVPETGETSNLPTFSNVRNDTKPLVHDDTHSVSNGKI